MVQTLNFLRLWGLPFSTRNFKMRPTFADIVIEDKAGFFCVYFLWEKQTIE